MLPFWTSEEIYSQSCVSKGIFTLENSPFTNIFTCIYPVQVMPPCKNMLQIVVLSLNLHLSALLLTFDSSSSHSSGSGADPISSTNQFTHRRWGQSRYLKHGHLSEQCLFHSLNDHSQYSWNSDMDITGSAESELSMVPEMVNVNVSV